MLVQSKAEGKQDLRIQALKNNFEADAYFVKVMGKGLICQVCSLSHYSPHAETSPLKGQHEGRTFISIPKLSSPDNIHILKFEYIII